MSGIPELNPDSPRLQPWWVAYPFRHLVLLIVRIIFLFCRAPVRVEGQEKLPATGGLMILSNHLSDCDPFAVQMACRRPIYFMGKSELFEMPIVGAMLRLYRTFPVRRGEPDRTALSYAINLLKAGNVVCIFPEGQLSETEELQPLKPGVALIARMAGVPVICLGLQNTQKVMPYGKTKPQKSGRPIVCRWGDWKSTAVEPTNPRFLEGNQVIEWATEQLTQLTAE